MICLNNSPKVTLKEVNRSTAQTGEAVHRTTVAWTLFLLSISGFLKHTVSFHKRNTLDFFYETHPGQAGFHKRLFRKEKCNMSLPKDSRYVGKGTLV